VLGERAVGLDGGLDADACRRRNRRLFVREETRPDKCKPLEELGLGNRADAAPVSIFTIVEGVEHCKGVGDVPAISLDRGSPGVVTKG
jgi:hypothetical protein